MKVVSDFIVMPEGHSFGGIFELLGHYVLVINEVPKVLGVEVQMFRGVGVPNSLLDSFEDQGL